MKEYDAESLYQLAWQYYTGEDVAKDLERAFELFNQAYSVKPEDPDILYAIGHCYLNGQGVEEDPIKALIYLQDAVKYGNSGACIDLGWMYFAGEGVEKDIDAALDYYRKGSELGEAICSRYMGIIYEDELNTPTDTVIKYYEIAISQGDATAAWLCARTYQHEMDGRKGIDNYHLIEKYYLKALELGYDDKGYIYSELGRLYLRGHLIDIEMGNLARAQTYFKMAISATNDEKMAETCRGFYEIINHVEGINEDEKMARMIWYFSHMEGKDAQEEYDAYLERKRKARSY